MTRHRAAAALIALGVFATIALRVWLRMSEDGESFAEAVWGIARFYTIWTNTLIGVSCAALAFGSRVSPQLLSNLLLSIIIVATVYHTLLADLNAYTGLDAVIDTMLHSVIPIAFVGYWLVFVPKSGIRFADIFGWLVLPLIYCIFAMARAQFDGDYPYFFLNLAELGVVRTGVNILGLLLAFAGIGALIVVAAKLLSARNRSAEGRKA